ncbi:MAG: ATP-binding cassette domain-containing protein [Lentisphaerae bacterium]|nr:ATP-binding cassette domain-containing protein [Lentisphaerota bacterium]
MERNYEPVVQAVGLTKMFRDFWHRPKARAVNGIDFEIKPGEVVGLLGPNGSGKSTTVKMLLGLLYPTGGKITVFGKSPRAVETKKEIGYLPEESYLYKFLTAEETLNFFGSLFNISAEDRKRRIDQLLEMVGLSHARYRRVGEFSKGMARRIGLAQAMINDPAFLILDEPTSGLDPLGCREVKDLILALKKRGKTVLITSHLLSDVEDICDRVIILYGGQVRAEGALDKLLTVSDQTRILTPQLPKAVMDKLLELLRANLDGEEFKIDHPRRTLEEFFLDVIAQARRESVETAGVAGSGGIAEYLAGEDEDDEKSALLNTLMKEPVTPEFKKSEAVEQDVAEKAVEVSADDRIASALKEVTAKVEKENTPAEESGKKAENMRRANSKLDSLLGDKSGE